MRERLSFKNTFSPPETVFGVLVLVVLVATGFYIAGGGIFGIATGGISNDKKETVDIVSGLKTYRGEQYGIRFKYPGGYFLSENNTGDGHRYAHAIVLTDSDPRVIPQNGEGPTSITIAIFQNNLDHYTTEQWIRGNNNSNFKLSPDGMLQEVAVGGERGLGYRYSGLYEFDSVVIARPENVYMFTVSWMDERARMRKDFTKLLETVTFGVPPGKTEKTDTQLRLE